ncbi:acylphosphatase [Verrucomicrobiota bacterium]
MIFIVMPVRVHLNISGRVQGVCFRYYCCEQAQLFGVKGFVRNNEDGSVEVVAEGMEKDIIKFTEWCRHGPPHATVVSFEEKHEAPTGEFDSFTVSH